MKKYQVSGLVTVSCNTVIEANSKEEALELAGFRELSDLCHGPHIEDINEAFHIEADGQPKELTVDDYYDEDDY